jgi:hypothetical protein
MCQTVEGAIDHTDGYAAGVASELVVEGFTGVAVTAGEFVVVAGNDQPTYAAAATVAAGNTTGITLSEALKYAVADAAAVTVYSKCAVKGDYAAAYAEAVVVDGWTKAPQVGQMVAFGTGSSRHTYTVIESWLSATGEQSLILDRPLDRALSNDDAAFPGPAGAMNMAFHRNALALVSRPLAVPNNAMGVMSHVGVYNDIAMRVSMQYDIQEGGTVVNLDILAGVAVLDENLCVVLLG